MSHIIHLNEKSFDNRGFLKSNQKNMYGNKLFSGLTVVMVQGKFCHYCTEFKPAFAQVAQELARYGDFATIQIDSPDADKQLFKDGNIVNSILGFKMQGVPIVMRFYQGRPWGKPYDGPRDADNLRDWVLSSFQ
jgi:thiol-disulfide isomerase/thioredoxin